MPLTQVSYFLGILRCLQFALQRGVSFTQATPEILSIHSVQAALVVAHGVRAKRCRDRMRLTVHSIHSSFSFQEALGSVHKCYTVFLSMEFCLAKPQLWPVSTFHEMPDVTSNPPLLPFIAAPSMEPNFDMEQLSKELWKGMPTKVPPPQSKCTASYENVSFTDK